MDPDRQDALNHAREDVARAIATIEVEFGFKDGLPILQPLAVAIQEIDNRRHALAESDADYERLLVRHMDPHSYKCLAAFVAELLAEAERSR